VRSITYGAVNNNTTTGPQDSGVLAYVNFSYAEAFNGLFPLDAGRYVALKIV
jgi:hypothetical protein